jgi:hypothetical protein
MAEDLESSTKAAWDEFERRLVARLDAMEEDDLLLVEVPGDEDHDGATPYVQFCAWGDDMFRCEVVSNHYLAETWALTEEAGAELVALGFAAPTHGPDDAADDGSSNYHVDVPRDETFDLGWMTVVALRDVYGIPHPVLLDADGVVDPPPEGDAAEPGDEHVCDAEAVEAHVAAGPDELQELVDAAMERRLGHPPHKDSDGDIPISTADAIVWVCVNRSTPAVDVWGVAYDGVADRDLALHEVAVLNRDNAVVKFVLRDGCIVGQVRVNGLPFVGAHLHQAVEAVCTAVDRAKEDLAPRFRAAAAHDEDDE